MPENNLDRWSTRDLPVLRWIVEQFDADADDIDDVRAAEALGITEAEAQAAVRNLVRGGYVEDVTWMSSGGFFVANITERALREVGVWPNAETMADQLLWFLDQRVDAASTSEERTKMARVRDAFVGAGRDFAVEVAAAVAAKSMGI